MSNYEDEYQKWVSSLSPKDRAKLVAQGLDNSYFRPRTCLAGKSISAHSALYKRRHRP